MTTPPQDDLTAERAAIPCVEVERLPYLRWHEDAEKRTKRGQKQKQCQYCKLWLWPYEWTVHRRSVLRRVIVSLRLPGKTNMALAKLDRLASEGG